ncbi:MAG: DUF4445 domain-containing protein [Armatimonadetes bacterium]|nr:DUF4445 domain-containing protein [Armatimonadota bacterium]
MSSHIVVFLPDGACLEVESGQTILEAATAAGVAIDSSCGGQGACGKCRVVVALGRPGGEPGDLLSKDDIARGVVLACRATVEDDLVVEVPLESQRGEVQILMGHGEGLATPGESWTPLATRLPLTLVSPEEERECSDEERLLASLKQTAGDTFSSCPLELSALRDLPRVARQNDWKLDALLADVDDRGSIFGIEPGGAKESYGLAVDIGTTTVVVHLIDLNTHGFVDACAALNDQVAHGEDVISRIIYTQEHEGGLEQLRDTVRATINSCVHDLTEAHGVARDRIIAAACAGNTAMTQLLLGIDPAAIRREPYVPTVRAVPTLRAAELGLDLHPRAPVHLAPCVSSYVGGDITAGVFATGFGEAPRLTLFIDMGTNGEMVVGSEEWLMCCSCSAGPAFEGSGVEYGMYGTVGAIERLRYEPETDTVEYMTIGEAKPRGLCGSGLVDALATLLRAGVIDRAGRVNLGFPSRRVRVRNERPEFVFVWGEEVGRSDDISLGEDGIQNLMRSKAAVYAGAETLLESLGLEAGSVEQILVAGAFGNYLDAESAVTIGLLPDVPLDRIRFVGNTSVSGARLSLLDRGARQGMEELTARMTNFELSVVPGYMDRYVSGLFLPHTDLGRFPSVASKLELNS